MQSKKRAKPVKFGRQAKEKPQQASAKDEKVVKEAVEPESAEEKQVNKGIEAHFTSTVETIDISTTSREDDVDPVKEDQVEEELPANTKPTDLEEHEEEEVQEDEQEEVKEDEANTADLKKEEEEIVSPEEDVNESLIDKDVAFFNTPPDAYDNKKSMIPYFLRVMLLTFVLGLVFFAGIYYAVSHKNDLLSFINRPTPKVTVAPGEISPTQKPVDLAAYGVRVLNGTSTAGEAAKLRDELKAAGFNVVSVGNAAKDDFQKTQIEAVKKVDQAFLAKLEETIKKSYAVGDVKTLSTASADVVVTIGSESAK